MVAKLSPELHAQVHDLLDDGMPTREISEVTGCKITTVRKWATLHQAGETPEGDDAKRRALTFDLIILHLRHEYPARWQSVMKMPGPARRDLLNGIAASVLELAGLLFTDKYNGHFEDESVE